MSAVLLALLKRAPWGWMLAAALIAAAAWWAYGWAWTRGDAAARRELAPVIAGLQADLAKSAEQIAADEQARREAAVEAERIANRREEMIHAAQIEAQKILAAVAADRHAADERLRDYLSGAAGGDAGNGTAGAGTGTAGGCTAEAAGRAFLAAHGADLLRLADDADRYAAGLGVCQRAYAAVRDAAGSE